MDRELNRAELDELLPLYALDALEGEEREQIARYVDRDDAARAEVQSLREAAALFARADTRAPASVWSGIERSLDAPSPADESRYEPPALLPMRPHRAPRRPRMRAAAALVAAAAFVAIAVLGVQVVRQQHRIDDLAAEMHHDPVRAAALAATTAPGSHTVELASSDGRHGAEIVMLADGSGYFMDGKLPRLHADHTYQLWAKVGPESTPQMVSVGLLGSDPGVVPLRLPGGVMGFEVTREEARGSVAPAAAVMMSGSVS